jgi:hypothetical protein
LNELSDVINSISEEPMDSLLRRYEADTIDINDDDKWEVEAPVIPETEEQSKEKDIGNILLFIFVVVVFFYLFYILS